MPKNHSPKNISISDLEKLFCQTNNKTYEEAYEKWLKSKSSNISKETMETTVKIMQPTKRHVVVGLPKCIDTALNNMEEDDVYNVLNGLFFNEIGILVKILIENIQRRGGTPNGKV